MTDITYIHTIKDGWCYLASVMDLHSRKIIGYSFKKSMTSDLAVNALENAYTSARPSNKVIIHSDRGSQYTSFDDLTKVENLGLTISFSNRGIMLV